MATIARFTSFQRVSEHLLGPPGPTLRCNALACGISKPLNFRRSTVHSLPDCASSRESSSGFGHCLTGNSAWSTAVVVQCSASNPGRSDLNASPTTISVMPQQVPVSLRKRVVSGVQPTGTIHLGNYLGAIKNWVALQDIHDTFFFVVDLHAITLAHDPKELLDATKKSAAIYIACGIDPTKASIFVQSHVKAHADLTWLLSCVTPVSWLNKMIQFKEKSRKAGEDVGTGLLTYPLLMASDILLYECDLVPVGEDQRQHLELTRNIAERVNGLYGGRKWKKLGGPGGRVFKVPDVLIPPAGARVMSLTDGTSKMSKSAPSDQSRINLLDAPDVIQHKVTRCKTDSVVGMEFDNAERPECNNLMGIYQLVTSQTKQEVADECRTLSWGQFKPLLADALVSHLKPIQSRYNDVMADPSYLDDVLREGAERAENIANVTLEKAYSALGFLPRKKR